MLALHVTDVEWERTNNQSRFHNMYVDLIGRAVRPRRLDPGRAWADVRLLGLPGKEFSKGEVYEHILRG